MSEPFSNEENADDLNLLMGVAVLCGRRTVDTSLDPIFEAWSKAYPEDALGHIGRGLSMISEGKPRDGYRLIEETARTAKTRVDQAKDVLASLQRDLRTLAAG